MEANEASSPPGLGVQVFAGNCANCHDWDGKGVQSPYADLRGSRTVNDPDATNLTAILLAGSNAPLSPIPLIANFCCNPIVAQP